MVEPISWRVRGGVLSTQDHSLVMGILNTTPDSFSDGSRHDSTAAAVAAGLAMWRDGADIVDVGGESTRPGATSVETPIEVERTVPVVAALCAEGVTVSVDTRKSDVAAQAIDAGAVIVNDVSGLGDPEMAAVCARAGVGVVVMHMLGTPETMQDDPRYDHVVSDVEAYILERTRYAETAGVAADALCIDPGIGFGKTFTDNLELLANLRVIAGAGYPVLVGASRKGFLGEITSAAGHTTTPRERDYATAATTALAIANGAAVIRAHNVPATLQAARTADAIVRAAHVDQTRGGLWPG